MPPALLEHIIGAMDYVNGTVSGDQVELFTSWYENYRRSLRNMLEQENGL